MLFKSIGMLFSFIDENRFVIKTILLTKYTSILLQLIGNLNFKIMYKNINQIDKLHRSILIGPG